MLDGMFASLYGSTISMTSFCLCAALSLLYGACIAWTHRSLQGPEGSMAQALLFLPFLVQIVILLVNGNLGAGVAVAGAFSLIRFRSAPGTAREITMIFLAMCVGLACGMGYVVLAGAVTLLTCGLSLCTSRLDQVGGVESRLLKITIPEDMDYSDLFEDLFDLYTSRHELQEVRTSNMGSLYALRYQIVLRDVKLEKEFIDKLRCRNGNLEITCGRAPAAKSVSL